MILHRIRAHRDARRAVESGVPLRECIEDKVSYFLRKSPLRRDSPYSIKVTQDGQASIIEEVRDDAQGIEDTMNVKGYEESGEEIANFDRRIRLEEEKLVRSREKYQVAKEQAEPAGPLLRDKLIALVVLVALSIGEIGALLFYLGDWFAIDPSRLPTEIARNTLNVVLLAFVALSVFVLLLACAMKVVQNWTKGNYYKFGLYLGILLIMGGCLGVMRALQATRGEATWEILLVCMMITAGVPIPAAAVKLWWRESALRYDDSQKEPKNLRREIREYRATIAELRRLRRNAERRRVGFERNIQRENRASARNRERQRERELRFLRKVVAISIIYREKYLFWSAKNPARRKR